MGTRGPIPKRSDQRHGHRKAEPVTKAPAGSWVVNEDDDLVYEPPPRPVVRRGGRDYYVLPTGVLMAVDDLDEEG